MRRWILVAIGLVAATPAVAQDRDYCPERPGLNTPACIIGKGRVSMETAFADWTRDDQPDTRTDTVLFADTLVRVGLTDTVEARVGWTPFGHQYQRDKPTGAIDSHDAVGDVALGFKASLLHPDGSGLSVALLPSVSLPLGRQPIGAGTWSASLLLPVTYGLSDTWSLAATPEVDAAADSNGDGRHLGYSGTAGLAYKLADPVTLTGEVQVARDEDPAMPTTQALAALSVGWMVQKDLQLDLFGAAGLNRAAPDVEVYAGISRRF